MIYYFFLQIMVLCNTPVETQCLDAIILIKEAECHTLITRDSIYLFDVPDYKACYPD